MTSEQERLLRERLILAFLTINNLHNWLGKHQPSGLSQIGPGSLEVELNNLMLACKANDDMQELLQNLCDGPPAPELPPMIFAFTLGAIKSHTVQQGQLPLHQRSFVAGRPFVNRTNLRQHLHELATATGGRRVLVIDGDDRCGKSFAMSMAIEISAPDRVQWQIDIDDYAKSGTTLTARDFAVAIVGHESGCPAFDITKENEAVPGLMLWVTNALHNKQIWIMIDHCNRQVMTHAARRLLEKLVERLYQGGLAGVRLILADFNRQALSRPLQNTIRYDRAELPTRPHVEDWCRQVAILRQKPIPPAKLDEWAGYVFENLDDYSHSDGSWHLELEKRLMEVAQRIS